MLQGCVLSVIGENCSPKRVIEAVFYRIVTFKMPSKSNQLFIVPQENNIWRLARIHCSGQKIMCGNPILVEIRHFKVLV